MSDAQLPQPLRVALLVPSLTGGGAEFVAVQWACHLRDHGHDVTVLTTHQHDGALPGIRVVPLVAGSFVARVRLLRRHVAGAGYDALLGLMPHWNILALLATLGADGPATLISGRNVEAPLLRVHGLDYRAELALCRLLYRRADAYVAISHPVAAEAAGVYRLDPDRVWVVPNPATGKDPARSAARRAGGALDGRTVTITVPARLVAQKRPGLAVETAYALAHAYGLEARVDFFGRGPEEAAVRETADRLGVPVRFAGWVTSWFDEAAPDAVVLLPSVAEGFGNVLVEAAAAGIPSVASSRALGVADAIVPGVTGVLTMGTAPSELAAAVVEAVRLAPVPATPWLRRFSPEESGRQLRHVLGSVVADRGPRGRGPAGAVAHRQPATLAGRGGR